MDILEQYEKENPEVSSHVSPWEPSEEYGGLSRFVIRLSRGRIQNEKRANYILLIIVLILLLFAAIPFIQNYIQSPRQASPKELHRYGKIE